MKKTISLIVLALIMFSFSDDNNTGLFVNEGKKKLTTMECYGFDNLTLKFPIKKEMFGYDLISIQIEEHTTGEKHWISRAGKGIQGHTFKNKYKGESYGSLRIFSDNTNTNDVEGGMTRKALQYVYGNASKNNAYLEGQVWGSNITGYREVLEGNEIVKYPEYTKADLLWKSEQVPLKNRKKTVSIALDFQKIDFTNCYPD